jgi:hypothetical protein
MRRLRSAVDLPLTPRSVQDQVSAASRKRYLVRIVPLLTAVFAATSVAAQQPATQPSVPSTALTIYNQDFAVARTQVDLDLHPGLNEVTTSQVTTQLEPDSVVLRDPSLHSASAKPTFHIVEQNYDAAVVTQDWLLQKYEGKTIDFQVIGRGYVDGHLVPAPIVQGKIVRAAQRAGRYNQFNQYAQNQPLIEVDGKLQFYFLEPRCSPPLPTASCSNPLCAGKSTPKRHRSSPPSSPTSRAASVGRPPITSLRLMRVTRLGKLPPRMPRLKKRPTSSAGSPSTTRAAQSSPKPGSS